MKTDLTREAEQQMGRRLPTQDGFDENHPTLGTFRYDAVRSLTEGTARGYIATCAMRRERSCAREASALLGYENQLQSAKVSARGVVLLLTSMTDDMEEGGTRDADVLSRAADLFENEEGHKEILFTVRIVPVLRTTVLDDGVAERLSKLGEEIAVCALAEFTSVFKKDEVAIGVAFNGRKLVDNVVKRDCISRLASGFQVGCVCKVRVDLGTPDILLIVEAMDVMSRNFLMLGVAPSAWLANGKLRGLSTLTPSRGRVDDRENNNKRRKVVHPPVEDSI